MLTKSKIAAIALGTSLVCSSAVQANQVSLETYVTHMVGQAMVVAQEEIQNNVRESVLNAAQKMSLNSATEIKTKVIIRDIKAKESEVVQVAAR